MVNITSFIIIKGDKLLVEYNAVGSNYRLPLIKLEEYKEDEKEEEEKEVEKATKIWIKERLQLKEKRIIFSKEGITKENKKIYTALIDAEEVEINTNFKNEYLWIDAYVLYNISYFDRELVKSVLQQCIYQSYSSTQTKSLELGVERIMGKVNYFENYRELYVNKNTDSENESKKTQAIIFSLIAGVLFTIFFFNYLGISCFIFAAYLVGGFLFINKVKNKSFMGYFLMGVGLILSVGYAIFTNPVFRVLNIIVIPISLFSGALLLTYSNITLQFIEFSKVFINKGVSSSFITAFKLPQFVFEIFRTKKKEKDRSTYKSIAYGIIISIPIIFILCVFLSGADEMFGYYLNNLSQLIVIDSLSEYIFKVICGTFVMFFIFGLFWSLLYKFNEKGHRGINKSFEPVMIITVLVMVSFIYMIFTKIQVSFLYFSGVLPKGFTYASYARNGFFQLVFLVTINLIVIVILKLKTDSKSNRQELILNGIYTLITIFTFNMAFSALYKMNLYINAFGYTRLRLLVQIFNLFLIIILCFLVFFIWKNINLFKPIVTIGALMYVGVNFINIDNYIVKKNVNLIPLESQIDKNYLEQLSLDAYPSMKAAVEAKELEKDIYLRWLNKDRNYQNYWFEYNYYKVNASKNEINK